MRKYFLLLIIMLIAASCGTAPPLDTDWCYTFDFSVWDNDFNIPVGYQVNGLGIHSVFGVLSMSYEHDQLVEPAIIAVKVVKPPGSAGQITATAAGIIFGSSASGSGTIDAGVTEQVLWFRPEVLGDAGTDINITINVEGGINDIAIQWIRVEGYGDTPFAYNPCADPAEHPTVTGTPTITDTPLPTDTPTNTPTPTPTNTPTDTPEVPDTATWTPTSTLDPNPTPVSYPLCSPPSTCIYDPFEFTDAEINAQQWGYYRTMVYGDSGIEGGVDGAQACWKYSSSGGANVACDAEYNFQGDSVGITNIRFWARHWSSNINYDSLFYVRVRFWDSGGTPSAWCDLDTLDDRTNYHTYYDWAEYDYSTAGCAGASDAYKFAFYIGMTAGYNPHNSNTWVDNLIISVNSFDPPATYTPYGTPSPTSTVSKTPFNIPTNTPFNYQPTVDLTQVTATASTTPSPTSTDYPQSTTVPYELTLTVGAGTPTYSVSEIRENEAEWELLQEQQESNNATQNLLQDILDALSGNPTSGDGGGPGGESGTGEGTNITGGASDWFSAISDNLTSVVGLFGKVGVFFGQASNAANGLVTAFYTAPPTAIPGLPQCMTSPLDYDICAIYYILDWTLFAPGTLGQFIVPLILAIMNTIIVFRVVRYVLKLIKRTEDVTR